MGCARAGRNSPPQPPLRKGGSMNTCRAAPSSPPCEGGPCPGSRVCNPSVNRSTKKRCPRSPPQQEGGNEAKTVGAKLTFPMTIAAAPANPCQIQPANSKGVGSKVPQDKKNRSCSMWERKGLREKPGSFGERA